jgi:hypothetical protein
MPVNIYLHIEDRQVLALSIPFSDIERLSVRPVKWLRFVTFAICGVRGDLSAMPNGPPVDYDSISLDDIAEAYYYIPEGNIHRSHICRFFVNILVYAPIGDYHLIDHNAMNDRITSSVQTLRSSDFRSNVMERDGSMCVFTGTEARKCDAAHLLAKSKGDEVCSRRPPLFHVIALLNALLVHRGCSPRPSQFVRPRSRI